MDPECHYTIPHRDIDQFYAPKDKEKNLIVTVKSLLSNPLLHSAARYLVNSKPKYTHCPATDCTSFAEILMTSSVLRLNYSPRNLLIGMWICLECLLLVAVSITSFASIASMKTIYRVHAG